MNSIRSHHKIRRHHKHSISESLQASVGELFNGHDLPTEAEVERSRRRRAVKAYRSKADAKRKFPERFADWMTAKFGTISFLIANGIFFSGWLLANTGNLPGVDVFDPYPFVMLTTIVSLEAIFLAIIVLISQNRASKVAEIREEEDLQINMIAEEEITKVIELISILLKKNHISVARDEETQKMLEPTDSRKIEESLEKQLL